MHGDRTRSVGKVLEAFWGRGPAVSGLRAGLAGRGGSAKVQGVGWGVSKLGSGDQLPGSCGWLGVDAEGQRREMASASSFAPGGVSR